jgi:signal transduction histidine kinase
MQCLLTVLLVSPDAQDAARLQARITEFLLTHQEALPVVPPADAAFALVDAACLSSRRTLPAWAARLPVVVYGAAAGDGPPEPVTGALAVTAESLADIDVPYWFCNVERRKAATAKTGDDLPAIVARLDHFSRRILEVDSPASLNERLPVVMATLLHFDGLAFWDWSAANLLLFCPASWSEAQNDLVTVRVRQELKAQHRRPALPTTTSRVTFQFVGHRPPARDIAHELTLPIGASEGVILLFRTDGDDFTPADRQLSNLAANLIGHALRNARLFAGLDAQSRKIIDKNRELLKASRLKTNFIANTSHELKTPLHAILGLAEVLPLNDSPGEVAHVADRIGWNARRLLEIVNNILDYSRLVSDEVRVYFESFDVNDFLREVVDSVVDLAQVKGLELSLSNDSAVSELHSDREKLFTILVNLLTNAIKFTPTGSVRLAIVADNGRLRFEVSDTGIGIPPGELARIFEEFHRVKGPLLEAQEGTGLGLAIAQGLAHLLGGELTVESEVGRGSTFRLTLPVWAPTQKPGAAPGLPLLREEKPS